MDLLLIILSTYFFGFKGGLICGGVIVLLSFIQIMLPEKKIPQVN